MIRSILVFLSFFLLRISAFADVGSSRTESSCMLECVVVSFPEEKSTTYASAQNVLFSAEIGVITKEEEALFSIVIADSMKAIGLPEIEQTGSKRRVEELALKKLRQRFEQRHFKLVNIGSLVIQKVPTSKDDKS